MKKVYWISGNIRQMVYVTQGVISKLWKVEEKDAEGIASDIIIFGNSCADADMDIPFPEEVCTVEAKLEDLLKELCGRQDGPNKERPAYNAKKNMVKDKVHSLYKKGSIDDSIQYQTLKQAWFTNGFECLESNRYEEASKHTGRLVERMGIGPGNVVGIDISLFYDDCERVRQGIRVISMELCHMFSQNGLNCFIYSPEANDSELIMYWNRTYKKFYQQKSIKIYQRSDFVQKDLTQITSEIESMFN